MSVAEGGVATGLGAGVLIGVAGMVVFEGVVGSGPISGKAAGAKGSEETGITSVFTPGGAPTGVIPSMTPGSIGKCVTVGEASLMYSSYTDGLV